MQGDPTLNTNYKVTYLKCQDDDWSCGYRVCWLGLAIAFNFPSAPSQQYHHLDMDVLRSSLEVLYQHYLAAQGGLKRWIVDGVVGRWGRIRWDSRVGSNDVVRHKNALFLIESNRRKKVATPFTYDVGRVARCEELYIREVEEVGAYGRRS